MRREDNAQAIRELVGAAERLQSEMEPLMALHTGDTVIVNIAGIRVLGKDAFREAMARALSSRLANFLTAVEVLDVRFVTDDVAIVSCVKRIRDENPDARGDLPLTGSLTYVCVREPDAWRIALAQTTPQAA